MNAGCVSRGPLHPVEVPPSPRSAFVRRVALALATPILATVALTPRADADIYWTNDFSIGRANADGSGVKQDFIAGLWGPADRGPFGIAVSPNRVYWQNGFGLTDPGTIGSATVAGTKINN